MAFIPLVFLVGVMAGSIFTARFFRSKTAELKTNKTKLPSRIGQLLVSFAVLMGIFSVTHIVPQWGGSKAITVMAHGTPLLDQQPVFSSREVIERLDAFGLAGREMYRRFTYTIDVIFPVSLFIFLVTIKRFVVQARTLSKRASMVLTGLPITWFAADMIENAIIFTLIGQFPNENLILGGILGYLTVVKFGLLSLSLLFPAVLFTSSVFFSQTSSALSFAPLKLHRKRKNNPSN